MKTALIQSVNFGRDGNARDYQAYGWHGAEHGFTWSLGHESALIFPRFEAENGYAVELYLMPRTADGGPSSQRVCIAVNGEEIGRATISLPTTLGFLAPPPSNLRDKYMVLRLSHPDAFATKPGEPALAVAVASAKLFRLEQWHSGDAQGSSSRLIAPVAEGTVASLLEQAERMTGTDALDLLSSFEMLAGNCEFGGIQRRFGAEPLSLLRFAGATIESAIRGLESEFAGIGEDLEATVAPDASKEWIISDRGYKLQYHTFMSSETIAEEHILAKERKKVAFLRRKFLEDLSESRKIFVCVDRFKQPVSAALPPFLALNRNGKHPMIWISESVDSEVGHVCEIRPGLYAARIDRLSSHGQPQSASLELWLSILVNAWLLAKKQGHIVIPQFESGAKPLLLEDEGRGTDR